MKTRARVADLFDLDCERLLSQFGGTANPVDAFAPATAEIRAAVRFHLPQVYTERAEHDTRFVQQTPMTNRQ